MNVVAALCQLGFKERSDRSRQVEHRLKSGQDLEADIIVSATGLQMLALGGVRLTVNGAPVVPGETFVYKGVMLGNVPNFAFCVGYTNASWTLRADLSSIFVCRLLNHMDRHRYRACRPACDSATLAARPLLDLTSGYVQRAAADLPKQAAERPWRIRQNYILDMLTMKLGRMEDGFLKFEPAFPARAAEIPARTRTAYSADD